MPITLRTYGTVGTYTLALVQEPATLPLARTFSTQLSLYFSKGADVRLVRTFPEGQTSSANDIAEALLTSYAAIGAQIVLGAAPTTPTPAVGTVDASTYTRAVPVTPGTPVPPGRGALVKGNGTFGLKLLNGGTITCGDPSGGNGSRIDGYAVVDVNLSQAGSGASAQVLY